MTHRHRQAALLPLLLTLVAPPAGAQEEDSRPAVAFRNQRQQALLESTIGAYRAGQPSQDAAGAQLEAAVVALFGAWAAASVGEPGAPSVSEIAGLAHAVIDMGSDDPMVEFIRATAENGRAVWPTVIRNLQRRGYPPMRRAAALRVHGQRMERNRLTAEQADWTFDELIPALVAEAATSDFYAGDRQRVLLHEIRDLIEPLGPDRMRPIVEALELTDRVWLSSVCRTDLELRTGWAARGTGFARDVPEDAWVVLAVCVERATAAATRAHDAAPQWPEPAERLVQANRVGADVDPRHWFEQAVRAQPDYELVYRSYMETLEPKWGGSLRAMYEFGIEAADTELYYASIPYRLPDVIIRACGYGEIGETMQLDPEVYGRASAILDRLCDTPECAANLPRNATILAAFAWRNEDWDTCRKALDRIGGTPDRTWSFMCRSTPDQITNDLRINTSAHRDALFAADDAAGAGRTADAIAQYQALLETPDLDLSDLVRDRLVPLERQVRFEAGDWVELSFGPNLAGWRVRAGDWVCEGDDTVVGTVRHDQGMTLVCGTPVGARWELRGAIDLSELPDDPFYYAGLLVHYHDEMRMTWYQGIGLTPASGRIGVMDRFTRETRVESPDAYPMKERFTFDLTVWDDHIAMSISGGEPFVTQLPSTWRTQQGPYFAIGTNVWRIPSHMRYSSFRVHQLDTCPDAIQRAIDAAP